MAIRSTTDDWNRLLQAIDVDASGGPREVVSPIDGATLGTVPEGPAPTPPDTPLRWAELKAVDRQRALTRFATALREHQNHLALALCLESGVPIGQCERTLSTGIDNLEAVAATLRLPPEAHNAVRWVPVGHVTVSHSAQHSLGDDISALASALYCGCNTTWDAPTGRRLLAHVILQLWRSTHINQPDMASSLNVMTTTAPPTNRPPNRVWVAASAPVEQAVEAIADGLHWHNGNGVDSVHHVFVDHSLHWELEQRLAEAMKHTVCTDPRDPDCQRARSGPVPCVRSIDESSAPPRPEDTWPDLILQPISELPPIETQLNSTCLFSCDQRDIDQVLGAAGHSSARICINTLPSRATALAPSAWWPWLRPQPLSVELDTP